MGKHIYWHFRCTKKKDYRQRLKILGKKGELAEIMKQMCKKMHLNGSFSFI